MTDHILSFTSPLTSLCVLISNCGWLQFRYFLTGILLIWANSGFAQESLLTGSDLAPLEACFEKQLKEAATNNEPVVDQAGLECVGLAVVPCKIKLFATGSIPKSECPNAEHEWWDVKLNQAYKVMMKEAKRADALGKNLSFSEVDSLLKMQRAWIGYRDATCHFSYLQFGGGTLGPTGEAECLLLLTARQTIFLTSYTLRWAERN